MSCGLYNRHFQLSAWVLVYLRRYFRAVKILYIKNTATNILPNLIYTASKYVEWSHRSCMWVGSLCKCNSTVTSPTKLSGLFTFGKYTLKFLLKRHLRCSKNSKRNSLICFKLISGMEDLLYSLKTTYHMLFATFKPAKLLDVIHLLPLGYIYYVGYIFYVFILKYILIYWPKCLHLKFC